MRRGRWALGISRYDGGAVVRFPVSVVAKGGGLDHAGFQELHGVQDIRDALAEVAQTLQAFGGDGGFKTGEWRRDFQRVSHRFVEQLFVNASLQLRQAARRQRSLLTELLGDDARVEILGHQEMRGDVAVERLGQLATHGVGIQFGMRLAPRIERLAQPLDDVVGAPLQSVPLKLTNSPAVPVPMVVPAPAKLMVSRLESCSLTGPARASPAKTTKPSSRVGK